MGRGTHAGAEGEKERGRENVIWSTLRACVCVCVCVCVCEKTIIN
jgi:hypothetical protein